MQEEILLLVPFVFEKFDTPGQGFAFFGGARSGFTSSSFP